MAAIIVLLLKSFKISAKSDIKAEILYSRSPQKKENTVGWNAEK